MEAILIKNVTLIDGKGGEPKKEMAVLVRDGRIAEVGHVNRIRIPDVPVRTIDADGFTLLPGFIDSHVHVMMSPVNFANSLNTPFSYKFYDSIRNMKATVAAGVTTVRDAGGADAGVKMAVENGLVLGPRMKISITPLSITGGHLDFWQRSGVDVTPALFGGYPGNPLGVCDGPDEVRKKVREVLRAGADFIKVCSTGGVMSPTDHPEFTQFTQTELEVMVEEAAFHRGIKVMAHAQGNEGIKNAVRAGVHSIEHGIFLDDEAIELMLKQGTYLVPTLLAPLAVLEMAEQEGTMPEHAIRKSKEVIEIHRESIRQAFRAGVKIAMGTDAGVMAHGQNLRELGLLCEIGMSPMEAIVAATQMAAACLQWEEEVGTIEKGKWADFVLTGVDPLKNIRALENQDQIVMVIKGGKIVKDLRKQESKTK